MSSAADIPEITPTELKSRLDQGDVPFLLDVRERGVEGAVNLKGGVLAWRQDVGPTLTAY